MHPVAFEGRKMNSAELRYPVHKQELLAIRKCLQKWHMYIDNGLPITILTDHENLQYLPRSKIASKRFARWTDEFQQYPLEIRYRPGKENAAADALSR